MNLAKKKIILVACMAVFIGLGVLVSSPVFAAEAPKSGYDWVQMPRSEQDGYCTILIYMTTGLGKHTSSEIEKAGHFFAGKLSAYYEHHPKSNSIEKATESAWSDVKYFLK